MNTTKKTLLGSAVALCVAVVGGVLVAGASQAAPVSALAPSVEVPATVDNDNIQELVEDGTADGIAEPAEGSSTESVSGAESAFDDPNGPDEQSGHQD